MKKYLYYIFIFCLILFTSCGTTTLTYHYDDPVQKVYVSSNYYDYNNGVSIVYINNIPYYQYYDIYKKYWYRKPVPYYRYHYIKQRPNYHKPHNIYKKPNNHNSRPSVRPTPSRPQSKPNIQPSRNPNSNNGHRQSKNNKRTGR